MKTISIPEDLHKELIKLKLDTKDKNAAELIKKLIRAYREQKFLELSQKFREMLKRNGKSFDEFLKDSEKIKEEIADEWFS
jgi:predicted CopG family antitoxin